MTEDTEQPAPIGAASVPAVPSSTQAQEPGWQPIDTAPKTGAYFIILWCPEDSSRWLARWQGGRWHGVDDLGITREGASLGDPDVVTGWFVSHWQPLPSCPSEAAPVETPSRGALDILGASLHLKDDRILKLHFRHMVTDDDRKHLIEVINAGEKALAALPSPADTFDPTNHHNALKCPYCNPDRLAFAPADTGQLREALEHARTRFQCLAEEFQEAGRQHGMGDVQRRC